MQGCVVLGQAAHDVNPTAAGNANAAPTGELEASGRPLEQNASHLGLRDEREHAFGIATPHGGPAVEQRVDAHAAASEGVGPREPSEAVDAELEAVERFKPRLKSV